MVLGLKSNLFRIWVFLLQNKKGIKNGKTKADERKRSIKNREKD